jgi:uncharacterized protein (DUF305 family)
MKMNRKPLIYGILGLLAGSAVTGLAMLLPTKTSPETATATPFVGWMNRVESPTAILAQTTSPVPFRPRMMGMGHSDEHFIVMMIPHHDEAVAMADLALSRSKRSEIRQLAQAIKTTQTQEIEQMRTWYKQWHGADVPTWQPGMGMGMGMMRNPNNGNPKQLRPNSGLGLGMGMGMGCRGMMNTDLSALQNAPDFDRAFIEEMIPHHQMGVMMAQMVINSQRPQMRNLAQSIVKNQTDEINQMQQWYQAWYK